MTTQTSFKNVVMSATFTLLSLFGFMSVQAQSGNECYTATSNVTGHEISIPAGIAAMTNVNVLSSEKLLIHAPQGYKIRDVSIVNSGQNTTSSYQQWANPSTTKLMSMHRINQLSAVHSYNPGYGSDYGFASFPQFFDQGGETIALMINLVKDGDPTGTSYIILMNVRIVPCM